MADADPAGEFGEAGEVGEVGDEPPDGEVLAVGDVLTDGDEVEVAAAEGVRDVEVSGGGGALTWRNIIATRNTSVAMNSTSPAIVHRPPRTAPPR